jgi:hypothetical protein
VLNDLEASLFNAALPQLPSQDRLGDF